MKGLENIKDILQSMTPVSEEELTRFCEGLTLKQFSKGDFLCREGQVEHYIFFLLKGVTRNYFSRDGKEFTVGFHFASEFVTAFYSFLTREPSPFSIEVIEDAEAYLISHQFLTGFYDRFKTGERIGRLIAESQYIKRLHREMELLSLTAEERYGKLMQRNPDLVQKISVKHLSSYLGIQPESLSRIRKQYLRK